MIASKYKILYIDPPWSYHDMKNRDPKMGGITYPTMTLDDIKSLPVNSITSKNCALFLWATMPLLREALEVIDAWGFRYTTCAFVWVKLNPTGSITIDNKDVILHKGIYSGLGHWVNGNAELCLFAKKGRPLRMKKNVKQIVLAPRGAHSVKPGEVRDRIVQLLGDLPRIELFARETTPGWDAIGFDIDGKDIRDSLGNTDE